MTDTNKSRGRQAEFDNCIKSIREVYNRKMNAVKMIYPDLWKKYFAHKEVKKEE